MDQGEQRGPRPFWDREDRELAVGAYRRRAPAGEQAIGGYLRTITQTEIVFTCAVCGHISVRDQYPGPTPKYCSSVCRAAAGRQAAAVRMRRMRALRRDPA